MWPTSPTRSGLQITRRRTSSAASNGCLAVVSDMLDVSFVLAVYASWSGLPSWKIQNIWGGRCWKGGRGAWQFAGKMPGSNDSAPMSQIPECRLQNERESVQTLKPQQETLKRAPSPDPWMQPPAIDQTPGPEPLDAATLDLKPPRPSTVKSPRAPISLLSVSSAFGGIGVQVSGLRFHWS